MQVFSLTLSRDYAKGKSRKNMLIHLKKSNIKWTTGYGSLKCQWLNDAFSKAVGNLSYAQ